MDLLCCRPHESETVPVILSLFPPPVGPWTEAPAANGCSGRAQVQCHLALWMRLGVVSLTWPSFPHVLATPSVAHPPLWGRSLSTQGLALTAASALGTVAPTPSVPQPQLCFVCTPFCGATVEPGAEGPGTGLGSLSCRVDALQKSVLQAPPAGHQVRGRVRPSRLLVLVSPRVLGPVLLHPRVCPGSGEGARGGVGAKRQRLFSVAPGTGVLARVTGPVKVPRWAQLCARLVPGGGVPPAFSPAPRWVSSPHFHLEGTGPLGGLLAGGQSLSSRWLQSPSLPRCQRGLGPCPPLSLWPHCSGAGMGRMLH